MNTPKKSRQAIVLSIAGSDSGAGAGIQADLKACASLDVHCATVITAITAQNTRGLTAISVLDKQLVQAQLQAIKDDFNIGAIKIGMLGSVEIANSVADFLRLLPEVPAVIDPVFRSSSGQSLTQDSPHDNTAAVENTADYSPETEALIEVYRVQLLPLAYLLTPNLNESSRILAMPCAEDVNAMIEHAKQLRQKGCKNVLLKGGHLNNKRLSDVLMTGTEHTIFEHPKIASVNTHGTGCTLSSLIAARLCQGQNLPGSIGDSIKHLQLAIKASMHQRFGEGHGPTNPMAYPLTAKNP